MAGIAGVSAVFGLSELDTLIASVASSAYKKMKSNRRYGPQDGGPSQKKMKIGSVVNNVVPGGVGHYKGDFKKRSASVGETALSQYGYRQEQEIYGTLSMNDCQYLTVQSVNLHMIARAVASAFARMVMKKHFGLTYASAADVLFPGTPVATSVCTHWNQFYLLSKTRSSDGTETVSSQALFTPDISSLTTLDDFIGALTTLFVTVGAGTPGLYSSDYVQYHAYQLKFAVSAPGSATPTHFSLSSRYVIDQDLISVNVLQVINLQNVTRSDTAGLTAGGTRDAIDANPVVGKCFHMQGIYPDVENQASSYTATTEFSRRLFKFVPPHQVGIGVPDINPVGEWRGVPHPQVFRNILSCKTGLRLEPGEIKKDVLRFRWFGTLNDLFRGLSYLQNSAVGSAEPQPVYASNKLGTCKTYAFEKVVPTGADSIEMNYHIDRFITAQMFTGSPQNSSRGEFSSTKYDLRLGTQA